VNVKKAVVSSAAYVGFFLISLTILTAVALIYTWISTYSPVYPSAVFTEAALEKILQSLPVAVALSLMLVLLIRTRSRTRAPMLSIMVSVIAIILYAGSAYLAIQLTAQTETSMSESLPFYEQRITQVEHSLLYTGKMTAVESGYRIEPIMHVDMNSRNAPRISYYRQGLASPAENRITNSEDSSIIEYSDQSTPFAAFVQPPAVLHRLLTEIGGITSALKQSVDRGRLFLLILTAAQVFFLTSSWSIIRSSRWPLLSALLALLALRGFFFLDAAFRGGIFAEVLKVLSLENFTFLAAPAGFILLGILFVLWGLVYNPAPKGTPNE
jgi:hypothetical protein